MIKIPIFNFFCKPKLSEDKIHPIIFKNSPINDEKEDVFGFSTQIDIIDEAIKNDSTLIGIIGDYGSGKSTLTELCDVKLCKKYGKAIRINLWDTFNETNTTQAADVNIFLRSFLYQLAQSNKKANTNFARYINERQSKNFGKLTLTMASKWALLPFALAGIFFVLFFTATNDQVFFAFSDFLKEKGIVKDITFLNFIKAMSYFVLFIGVICVYIGIKIGAFVFSLWDSQGKILPEAGDVFENYERIINRLIKPWTKKQIIYIEDLDRINSKNLIIPCLKELYRFANILPPLQKMKIVFIVSLKSESSLQEENIHGKDDNNVNNTNTLYSKIFDYTLWIKPFHYENVSDIVWHILNTKSTIISKLIGGELSKGLLHELRWILIGENLTIREIKDRLNAVFTLYQTIKTRDFKGSSVDIGKCCASVYLQRAYSSDYEKLLKHEKNLAELIRQCYLYQKNDLEPIAKIITETLGGIKFNHSEQFLQVLSNMIFDRDIDEDLMMYFYNYPKNSYIKNIDEKDIVDYIHASKEYKKDIQLPEKINRVITQKAGKVIRDSIDELKNNDISCPHIILEYNQLFCFTILSHKEIILDALKELSKNILKNPIGVSSALGRVLFYDFEENIKNEIINSMAKIIHDNLIGNAEADIINARLQIIENAKEYIELFRDIFVSTKMPIISLSEIESIGSNTTKLNLININLISKNNYKDLFIKINSLDLNDEEYKIAENIYLNTSNMESFSAIQLILLNFLSKNKQYNSQLISIVLKNDFSDTEKEKLCLYLQEIDLSRFTMEELTKIDNLNLTKFTNMEVILFFEKTSLLKSALLSRSALNKIDDFDFTQDGVVEKLIDFAAEFNKDYPDYFLSIRLAAIRQLKTNNPKFYKLFINSYPLIRDIELEYIGNNDNDLYFYMNHSEINDDNCVLLSNYCNKMHFEKNSLFNFFTNLFESDDEDENYIGDIDIIKIVLSSINFKDIHFESMTDEQQKELSKIFEPAYNLTSAIGCIEFMETINCLLPELEKTVLQGAKNNEIEYSQYLDLLNDIQKPTNTTLNNMKNIPVNQPLSPLITEWLHKNNYFMPYLVGKSLYDNNIPIDSTIPILSYYNALIHSEKFAMLCFERKDILFEFARNKVLDKNLKDSCLINFYTIRQPIFLIIFILERLHDKTEEIKKYLHSIADIDTEQEANEFIDVITDKKYIELLYDKDLFYCIYHKMWNKTMKQKLTFRVNKKLETKYNAKEAGDYDDVEK
jgi:hypothetical protein